jgi:hypothetical protein
MILRALSALMFAVLAATFALPGVASGQSSANGTRTVVTFSWVEEWDPAAQRWVRVDDNAASMQVRGDAIAVAPPPASAPSVIAAAVQFTAPGACSGATWSALPMRPTLAQYGPFRVLHETRAALVGSTDSASPRHFDAMLHDFPGLAVLEMIDAPGTSHDLANLALGRRIRAAGLETHVPAGGSVRSGAVELFLAGTRHRIAPGASFAVHSWLDTRGLEPRHFAEDAPENRLYLDYYAEMGMSPEHARAFYAMTNSVPHMSALWLDAAAMQQWIAPLASSVPAMLARAAGEHAQTPTSDSEFGLRDHDMIGEAHWVWQTMMQAGKQFAFTGPVPPLEYADLGFVTLARLDSSAVFP